MISPIEGWDPLAMELAEAYLKLRRAAHRLLDRGSSYGDTFEADMTDTRQLAQAAEYRDELV